MAASTVAPPRNTTLVAALLDSPEIAGLIARLEATRWTGRPGYPIRAMVGLALVKSVYALPTWTRTVALVRDHAALRDALGAAPSVDAAYRFTVKLRRNGAALAECVGRVIAGLRERNPEIGRTVAVDGSDMPAYANGQRYVSKGGKLRERFSDPDATWGHRSAISTRKGGGFYGYKLHAAVCTSTGLPLAWHVATASAAEVPLALPLIDAVRSRGFAVEHAVLDKGYDAGPIYDECEERSIRPVIALRKTPAVVAGKDQPPACEHGTWTFAGSDTKRGASKWRCPTAECQPASRWVKADRLHTLVPRGTERWRALYKERAAVEREFGNLKHGWGLTPLRVRRLARVRLHADLTILARLAIALAAARPTPRNEGDCLCSDVTLP